ncbi:MAG: hypothetical protein SFU98_08745 [Leptospiraceae bacterium]|nr:hypothetical protein [Leptospiraceae bacterium]
MLRNILLNKSKFKIYICFILSFNFCSLNTNQVSRLEQNKKELQYNDIFSVEEKDGTGIWAGNLLDLNSDHKNFLYFKKIKPLFSKPSSKKINRPSSNICKNGINESSLDEVISKIMNTDERICTEPFDVDRKNYIKFIKKDISIIDCNIKENSKYYYCDCIYQFYSYSGKSSAIKDFQRIFGKCDLDNPVYVYQGRASG